MQSRLLFMALILPCPGSITMSAVIKFSSSEVIDRVGRVPGILILILLGLNKLLKSSFAGKSYFFDVF